MSSPATAPVAAAETTDAGAAIIRVIYRDGAGNLHMDWPPDKIPDASRDRGGALWVDFQAADDAATREVEVWLRDVFQFHHLAVEDALQETHVPKVDDWGSYLYIVFRVPRIDSGSDLVELHELDVFLGLELPRHVPRIAACRSSIAERSRTSGAIRATGCDTGPTTSCSASSNCAVDQSLAVIEAARRAGGRDPERRHRASLHEGHPLDLPDQAVGHPAPQDPHAPARGPQPAGTRSLSSRSRPSIASISATCTIMSSAFTISRRACAT